MDASRLAPHRPPPRPSRTVIGVAVLLLCLLSAAIIGYNVRQLNRRLDARLDNALDLARTTLPPAIWQFNYDYLNNFVDALFVDNRMVYAVILTDDEPLVFRSRPPEDGKTYDAFRRRPGWYTAGEAASAYPGRRLGTIRLVLSRKRLYKDLIINTVGAIALMAAVLMVVARYYARLRASEKGYRALHDNAIEGIFQSLPDGRFASVNPAMARMFGFNGPEEMRREVRDIGKDLYLRPEDRRAILEALKEDGHVYEFETEARRRNGETFWVSISVRAVRDAHGAVQCIDGMVLDVSERKEKERALDQQRTAEASARAKSEFLANMSHEIRTPMNAVIGLTELALRTDLPARRTDYLKKIQTSSRTLMGIIDDILDFSKIDAGKLTLETTPLDLDAVLEGLSDLFAENADGKGLALTIAAEPSVPRDLVGDPLRLGQVLINLVGNAVKFTREGEIQVRVAPEAVDDETARLRFSVRDTGIGIPAEQLERLFDPFTQADGSTTRLYGGAGLGLTISKRLVEMMGGDIQARNTPEGGALFTFTAVFGRGGPAAEAPLASTRPSTAAPPPSLRGARVLLVEDNAINQQVAIEVLEHAGIRVAVAQNGREAVDALTSAAARRGRPLDAVLMDLQMPVMDGFEAARRIRARERESGEARIPIIAMTAHALERDREASRAAGMDDYVVKPIQTVQLYRALQQWIGRRTGTAPDGAPMASGDPN